MEKVVDFFTWLWERILHFFYWPLLFLRILFFPLSKITFVIIILLLGFYAICINDQGQDMMASFTATSILKPDNWYLRFFELFVLFWAISIWNVARVLLTAANLTSIIEAGIDKDRLNKLQLQEVVKANDLMVVTIDKMYSKYLQIAIIWYPRILAMIPYFIFYYGYQKQAKAFQSEFPINIIIMMLIAVGHFLYMLLRRRIVSLFVMKKYQTSNEPRETVSEEKNLFKALKKERVFWNTILTVIMVLVMFIYASYAATSTPEQGGKPGLIVLTGLTFYTLVGLVINYISNRVRFSFFLLVILISVFIFFDRNNNHTIQTLNSDNDLSLLNKRNMLTDSAYADYWLSKKFPNTSSFDTCTVYVIAAEGGGIRNCYWTYNVLTRLQSEKPGFYDKTFAVTGVSGGSIGLGFYYSFKYFYDQNRDKIKDSASFFKKLDTIASSDYLSAVTYSFLFQDLFQRFLPFPIESWDRSKKLANSFDAGFSSRFNIETCNLSTNYLQMWSNQNQAYKYPVILYNTILNEDGLKAIFAPFALSDTYFPGAVDILYEINQSVPIKEAMTSSARFPLLTAPGVIKRYDQVKRKDTSVIGHISDGGGFENTGIHTAMQTAKLLSERIKAQGLEEKIKVKVIYIGTGSSDFEIMNSIPAAKRNYSTPITKGYEVAWLSGGVNTIFGWMRSSYNYTVRIDSNYRLLQFRLNIKDDSSKHQLPLGWFLSDTSRALIRSQLTNSLRYTTINTNLNEFKKLK